MRTNHLFLIESDSTGHRLSLDGRNVGEFPTLNDAETKAFEIARASHAAKGLRFELDFAWTLSDAEIRVARLTDEVPERMQ